MDFDDLLNGLDDEQAEKLRASIEAVLADKDAQIERITTNRDRAMDQLKGFKRRFGGDGDVLAELESLREFKERVEAGGKRDSAAARENYEKALAEQQAQHERELAKRDEQIADLTRSSETLGGELKSLRLNGALGSLLDEHRIAPHLRKAAQARLQVEGLDLDEEGRPQIGGKAAKEFLTEWVKTDEGKAFVAAAANSGGGAGGAGNGGGGAVKNPFLKESRSATEAARIKSENPELYARFRREAGLQ